MNIADLYQFTHYRIHWLGLINSQMAVGNSSQFLHMQYTIQISFIWAYGEGVSVPYILFSVAEIVGGALLIENY